MIERCGMGVGGVGRVDTMALRACDESCSVGSGGAGPRPAACAAVARFMLVTSVPAFFHRSRAPVKPLAPACMVRCSGSGEPRSPHAFRRSLTS